MPTRKPKSKKADPKPVERKSAVRFRFDHIGHALIDHLNKAFKADALHPDDTIEGVYPLAPVFRLVENPDDGKALLELLRQDPGLIIHPVVWSCLRDLLHAAYWEEGSSSYGERESLEKFHASLIQSWIEAYLPGYTLEEKKTRGPRPPSGYDLDIQGQVASFYDDLMATAEEQKKRGFLKPKKNLSNIACRPSPMEQRDPPQFEGRIVKELQTVWKHSIMSIWPVPVKAQTPSGYDFVIKTVSLPKDEIVKWVQMVNNKNLDYSQYRTYFAYYMIAYYLLHRTFARPKRKKSDKAEWVRSLLQSHREPQKPR